MAIVGFHVGGQADKDFPAGALGRALAMTSDELKAAFDPESRDGPDIGAMTLEKLNILVAVRGGRPIAETEAGEAGRRDALEVLDELYEESLKP